LRVMRGTEQRELTVSFNQAEQGVER
jgi:hypothetical protein